MKCHNLDSFLSYCDNTLTPKKRQAVDEHLQKCISCRHKMDLVNLENELIKEAADIPPLSETFTSDLMTLIETRYGSIAPQNDSEDLPVAFLEKKKSNWGIMRARVAIAAVFLLVFLGVSQLLQGGWIDLADKTPTNSQPVVPLSLKQDRPQESIISGQVESYNAVIKSESKEETEITLGYSNNLEKPAAKVSADTGADESWKLAYHPDTAPSPATDKRDLHEAANRGKSSPSNVPIEEAKMLLPSGLPESYQLLGASQGSAEYSFTYKKIDNGVELKITVNPQENKNAGLMTTSASEQERRDTDKTLDPQSMSSKTLTENLSNSSKTTTPVLTLEETIDVKSCEITSSETQQSPNSSQDIGASPESMVMQNSIKETLLIDNQEYQVTFSGNLPPEELASVAAVIDWQESKLAAQPTVP
ncbi:MAG: zf-HC2 domain-containing protein [Syntrophomonas sp.]|uniref:anti-sigma factor family protein n=1 Tax=Syntrophomonas sp. TaxID=2053627 RepID=UPI0026371F92|nr:zf-HC2 domain-containing protein [Syntrophomonas sp.]MDD2509743.1 zf-HC2 domain-containing protein [Syntrophomonas sp.]MDD3880348.1 zf-HC2 domain-containing protein [Syntrophomonas sp.]MDD4626375.1 zf-HC2 domain-containing protein [Syntrophomonas sp.]